MARWLSDEEQQAWRGFLAMHATVFAFLDHRLQVDSELPHPYYQVLAMLSEAPERSLRMSELARITNSSASRISHAVARLEEKGWVRREAASDDGRSHFAVLTDKGFEVLKDAAPGHVQAVREVLFDRLTPAQVTQLKAITERVNKPLT